MNSATPHITLNQSSYIPAEERRPHMREVVDSVITEPQRKREDSLLFTANGLRATLLHDDPVPASILDKHFKPEHWNLLSFALELQKTHIVGGMDLGMPYAEDVKWACEGIRNKECKDWLMKLHTVFEMYSGEHPRPLYSKFLEDETFRLELNVWRFVHWLYRANAVVTHIEPLYAGETTFTLSTLKEYGTDITHLYEALRPAADLWRSVPYEAIAPFEELGAARDLINGFDHKKLFELALQISERGTRMDDNEGHNDKLVQKWWGWTNAGFDYLVHCGINPFSNKDYARDLHEFISNACMAFDPANPVNAKALSILNKGNPVQDGVIIKNQSKAYERLCEYRDHLKRVIEAIETDAKPEEFVRPKHPATSAVHLRQ